jgi:hypothetical protein
MEASLYPASLSMALDTRTHVNGKKRIRPKLANLSWFVQGFRFIEQEALF